MSFANGAKISLENDVTLDRKIEKVFRLSIFDYGQSDHLLSDISELIRLTQNSTVARKKLEYRMLYVLKSETTSYATKQFICKQLAIIGTDESVPDLSHMLSDPETSDIACIAS